MGAKQTDLGINNIAARTRINTSRALGYIRLLEAKISYVYSIILRIGTLLDCYGIVLNYVLLNLSRWWDRNKDLTDVS
jgi:hypothetical protein